MAWQTRATEMAWSGHSSMSSVLALPTYTVLTCLSGWASRLHVSTIIATSLVSSPASLPDLRH